MTGHAPLLVGAVWLLASTLAAGCGAVQSATPTPSVAQATDAPSPTASPTGSPVPSATPSPTADPGDSIIGLFLASFVRSEKPFHVEADLQASGSVGARSVELSMSMAGDVAGEDFRGEITLQSEKFGDLVVVDGVAYGRLPGGEWAVDDRFVQTQPLNPFARIQAADLMFVGTIDRGGRQLHELQTLTWLGGELKSPGMTDIELDSTACELFVDDQGIPVDAWLTFTITGRIGDDDASFSYAVSYLFSRVGEPVSIEPPI